MQPEVYVPSEQPPPRRLYIVTHGLALYRGKRTSYSPYPCLCVTLTLTHRHGNGLALYRGKRTSAPLCPVARIP